MIVFLLALGVCTSGTALLINLSIDNLIKCMLHEVFDCSNNCSESSVSQLNSLVFVELFVMDLVFNRVCPYLGCTNHTCEPSCTRSALVSCVHYSYCEGAGVPEVKSVLSGVVLHNFLSLKTFVARSLSLIFAVVAGALLVRIDELTESHALFLVY